MHTDAVVEELQMNEVSLSVSRKAACSVLQVSHQGLCALLQGVLLSGFLVGNQPGFWMTA